MGKWTDTLLGTSEGRKKKQRRHELQKKALQEQKDNKNMRTLYRERNREEIRLKEMRNTKNKDKSKE
jgi:hypothetical protein